MMIKNLEPNKAYDISEVLQLKKRKPLWQIRMEHQIKVDNKKAKNILDKYTSKYGYAEYDLDKCNEDNMPHFLSVNKGEYNEDTLAQLLKEGIATISWDMGRYNCVGLWPQTIVCRNKDYKGVCNQLGLKMYTWDYEADRGILYEDWDKWSIVCGVHDGLWDEIGDCVEDSHYARNAHKRDAVVHIIVNYTLEHMDRFINYFFKYEQCEAIERIYFDSKCELGIK